MHSAARIGAIAHHEPRRRRGVWAAIPSWGTSLGFHAVALGLLTLVVFYAREEDPMAVIFRKPQPALAPPDRLAPPEIPSEPTPVLCEESEVTTPVSPLETEVQAVTDQGDLPAEAPDGADAAVADVQLASDAMQFVLGAGGGDAGKWGAPDGSGPTRAAIASRKSRALKCGFPVSTVETALRWFKKHQSPNGMWDVDGYQQNCADAGLRCEPGTEHVGDDGDVACTAYALMCFLGAGYDHHAGMYRSVVKRGIDHLLSTQKADGSFGSRNYENAIATMALADAYASSGDPSLRAPAQRGVRIILARQNADAKEAGYRLGWDYGAPNRTRNDSSVTGWNVMALKSALGAGLDVGDGLQGARAWLEQAWKAANPAWASIDPYKSRTVFPYTFDPVAGATDKKHLAAVGAMCAVFLGTRAGDAMLESLINQIMDSDYPASVAWPTNTYLLYYNTMAMFQATSGGNDGRWKRWDQPVRKMIVAAQRTDAGCFAGSWDFAGTAFPGHDVGRLLSTAYCCLSLEVYYRKGLVQH
jgi:hypothetical protein